YSSRWRLNHEVELVQSHKIWRQTQKNRARRGHEPLIDEHHTRRRWSIGLEIEVEHETARGCRGGHGARRAGGHWWSRGANTDRVHDQLLPYFCGMQRVDRSPIRMIDDRATRAGLLRHVLDDHGVQRMENVDGIKLRVQGNGSRVSGIVGHL